MRVADLVQWGLWKFRSLSETAQWVWVPLISGYQKTGLLALDTTDETQ